MSPMPRAAGRKAAALGSLAAGIVAALAAPAPHAHAATPSTDRGAGSRPGEVRADPGAVVQELDGEVTHGLGTLTR